MSEQCPPAPLFSFADHCAHCRDTGYVLPDGIHNVAWPCPMCSHGRRKSVEAATNTHHPTRNENGKERGRTASQPPHAPINMHGLPVLSGGASHGFWHNVDHGAFTWNGGLTAWHRYRCSMAGCYEAVLEQGVPCTVCVPDPNVAASVPRYRDIFAAAIRSHGEHATQQSYMDAAYKLREEHLELAAADHADELAAHELRGDEAGAA